MARRDRKPACFPACSQRHGNAGMARTQSAGEPVCVMCEVVEPLLRRADLLSQLLQLGCAYGTQEHEA